ncbi:hypothetical protein D9619_009064 [Psilocybe cf. subviscida]|uniref:Uncharacterized protein n=1 Tax=Psilocybe cf. subviscida TaxID=2480587 RepID=A0A8H5FAI6_9AGAR|nr:hypothetical protein D9619_009064 [Psilocybe cf. subviscida]
MVTMLSLLTLAYLALGTSAQTWCGKHYKPTLPATNPGGQFTLPTASSTPLLALRCQPAIRPYLAEDDGLVSTDKSILIDTPITNLKIANAAAITLPGTSTPLSVSVSVNGKVLTSGSVPLNATKQELKFSLSSLTPQTTAYVITCTATLGSQTFTATGSLSYLPNPPSSIGSVTKIDQRTGALLAKPANGSGGPYATVFPVGFYTQFDGYLDSDFTIPAKLASQGFNVIHTVPTFDNLTALSIVLDNMEAANMYLMYDMRYTYMDSASVTTEVNRIKSRPNLLLWYTADEPDGTSDPLTATVTTRNLIQSLDGGDGNGGAGYHPISLVLNCENFHFTCAQLRYLVTMQQKLTIQPNVRDYSNGADIIMQDAYMIGNNVTFSTVWKTPCNTTYGDCGCDNCKGSFEDISTRMEEFKQRLFYNGWDRTKAVWTVPQGFGVETYWPRDPTGAEFVVQSIMGINHGGLGVVSWDDPTTADIKSSASLLAKAIPRMTPFILNPAATFRHVTSGGVDIGLWTVESSTLVLAANMNSATASVAISPSLGLNPTTVTQVLNSGASVDSTKSHFTFNSVGSGAFIVG